MSVISVYRAFYWTESRLAGQTGYIWETKEEQARCIKDPHDPTAVGLLLAVSSSYVPPTKDQQRRDARYHISSQNCLCGIHGYFSPSYLGLVTATTGKEAVVRTRIRLGGLVDIHSMGARGEYGLIEEAWCDDDIAEAVAKRYEIPVNQSEFDKQPRTDPIIDKDVKVTKLAPMFSGMPAAVAMKGASGIISGPAIGMQTVITQTIQKVGGPLIRSAFGQPTTFQQYMALMGGSTPPPANSFGVAGKASPLPGHGLPPASSNCQCGICARVGARSPHTPLCPALSGGSCLCGVHGPGGRGVLGSWQCPFCGTYERSISDHTAGKCLTAMPKIVPTGKIIKPGIITRIKRKLNRWGLGI